MRTAAASAIVLLAFAGCHKDKAKSVTYENSGKFTFTEEMQVESVEMTDTTGKDYGTLRLEDKAFDCLRDPPNLTCSGLYVKIPSSRVNEFFPGETLLVTVAKP